MPGERNKGIFYSGISGLQLPVPKYSFPEEFQNSSRLMYYASFFNSIEINSCFYKVPLAKTLKKWSEDVPSSFKFTFKLWKEITHVKDLDFKEDDVHLFMEALKGIGEKTGCLLVQFPPSITFHYLYKLERLLQLLSPLAEEQDLKIAVEFRNKSWYQEETYHLIDHYAAAVVIHDIAASATPFSIDTSSHIYMRFHGPEGNYRGSYSEDHLHEYASYVKEWLAEGKTVFAYFNNTIGEAFNNLITLNNFVKSTKD